MSESTLPPVGDDDPTTLGTTSDWKDERIAELEAQVAKLSEQLYSNGLAHSAATSGAGFDADAREAELVAQGVSEADAAEQAAYEQRTYVDNQNRQA